MVDYLNTFTQLGAELRNIRKIEAFWEHSHFASNVNFSKRLISAAYDETIDEEELAETFAKNFLENTVAVTATSLHASQVTAMETSFFLALDEELNINQADVDAGAITYTYNELSNGAITIARRNGRYGVLQSQMVADAQTIRRNVVAFGALVADAANPGPAGSITLSSVTGEDHTLGGSLVLEVVDDTVSRPQLTVTLDLTQEVIGPINLVNADKRLTVDQVYEDGQTGAKIALIRPGLAAPTESGDDGAMFSVHAISDPTESDSSKGKIFIKVTRLDGVDADFQVDWFSNGGLTVLRGQQLITGVVGTTPIDITAASGMKWTATFDNVAAAVKLPVVGNTDSDIDLDINSVRLGDRFTISVTNDESGEIATKLAKVRRASLNSVADPGQTISDALATSIVMQ